MKAEMEEMEPTTLAELQSGSHWVVIPQGVEGMFLVSKLLELHYKGATPEKQDAVLAYGAAGNPIYFLRKTRMSAEQLSAVLGKSPEKLAKAKVINLKLKVAQEGLPTPNVAYWGTA